jgi:hypothetical protein
MGCLHDLYTVWPLLFLQAECIYIPHSVGYGGSQVKCVTGHKHINTTRQIKDSRCWPTTVEAHTCRNTTVFEI